DFINAYFSRLGKVFARIGLDPDAAIKAVWAGTGAMIKNDGAQTNRKRFWDRFAAEMPMCDAGMVEGVCDAFYTGEFDGVKAIFEPGELPGRLVRGLNERGFSVVLATNPLFPRCAVETRLKWAGLTPEDFVLVTDYSNSSFCKPNLSYYREILAKIGRASEPGRCLMAGNNPEEDMCAAELGIETYLVAGFIEGGPEYSGRRGTLAELEEYLGQLPKR
ncbi:MAG: HAD family hydrolase, partial [Oscillospiraceae bacterium]|nr:HAD family hydrolase [Oscillospiraceae bacterium]